MHPPLDVPSAPPSSSAYSRVMPCSRIAVLSKAVLAPGSPEASIGVGRGRRPSDHRRTFIAARNPRTVRALSPFDSARRPMIGAMIAMPFALANQRLIALTGRGRRAAASGTIETCRCQTNTCGTAPWS